MLQLYIMWSQNAEKPTDILNLVGTHNCGKIVFEMFLSANVRAQQWGNACADV